MNMTPRNKIILAITAFLVTAAIVQGYQIISILNEMPTTAKAGR